jgi:hypothetical protein
MTDKQVGRVVLELRLNDVVRLRKQHPCGSLDWRVVRLGADIGIKCCKCGRRVLLPRRVLERRVKSFVSRGVAGEDDNQVSEPKVAGPLKGDNVKEEN